MKVLDKKTSILFKEKKIQHLCFLKIRWAATRSIDFPNYKDIEKEHGIPLLVVVWKMDASDQRLHEVSLKTHFSSKSLWFIMYKKVIFFSASQAMEGLLKTNLKLSCAPCPDSLSGFSSSEYLLYLSPYPRKGIYIS